MAFTYTSLKDFLPLAKEAKKLAEALKKEQDASQWAGIQHEKLLQESFVKQLNSNPRTTCTS